MIQDLAISYKKIILLIYAMLIHIFLKREQVTTAGGALVLEWTSTETLIGISETKEVRETPMMRNTEEPILSRVKKQSATLYYYFNHYNWYIKIGKKII